MLRRLHAARAGTAGSVLGLGLVWALTGPLGLTLPYYLLATAVLFVIGIWISSRAEPLFGHDGPRIVIDEIAGVLIVFAGMPLDPVTVVAGFVLFRVLDIWKPFPCDRMQRLPGGLGVMMDDAVAAGLRPSAALAGRMDHIMKSAAIITIGDELLYGSVVDTNAAYIGRRMTETGIEPVCSMTVATRDRTSARRWKSCAGRRTWCSSRADSDRPTTT